ncbi:PHD finger protein ALFIN-LIKE 4-like isoform X3 [Camellia sinensis]|uniref:PHD finger protein ALFIN-LIKE 4-like isoform X3 n=1 Tax=Camellia sinensis TaxID=4442 RepID=UPI001035DA03|nr:PHD finger protein ALFIN-LIKE 4-like isoform X3 [Camellia sinensis]
MDGGAQYNPRTVEEVFRDFKGRRAGMIKALTTDVEEFYQQCDPEKENLCLYGFPSEQWEVNLPAEEVPPELPEPALGINFARDGMQEKDWLALVAVHSDAWLLAVAFYFGARFGFDKADRKRLFNMINDLPTIFEVVTGSIKKQVKDKSSVSNHSSNKPKSNSKGDLITRMIGSGRAENGLYILDHADKLIHHSIQFPITKEDIWHRRLGHLSFLLPKHLFPSSFMHNNVSEFNCESCQLGK